MNGFKGVLSLLLGLVSTFSFANQIDFPQLLIYNSIPIDPLCFYETEEQASQIDLTQCGLHAEQGRSITGENTYLTDQGFFGYDYAWKMEKGPAMHGYSYYKPLGLVEDMALIETLNNSGGTGEFTTLSLIKRKGNHLKIEHLNSGDRCNNGIQYAKIVAQDDKKRVEYGVNITAFDFLDFEDNNPHHLKAYDDLDSCAVCCTGVAIFSRPLDANVEDEQFLYVDVSQFSPPEDAAQSASGVKYQACFDELLKKYKKKYSGKLDSKALSAFTTEFNHSCVEKKHKEDGQQPSSVPAK